MSKRQDVLLVIGILVIGLTSGLLIRAQQQKGR